jgi:hypothetical protein
MNSVKSTEKENEYEEQDKNDNNEEHEENSINVYDDNAYMLGEDDSDNNSLNNLKKNEEKNENDIQCQSPQGKNEIEGLDEEVENEEINQDKINYLKYMDPKIDIQKQQNNKNNNNNDNMLKISKDNNEEFNQNQNLEEGDGEGEGQEEEEDDNIPLVTLKYISVCQYCKNQFDSTKHLPYLFKCGHFFCKECIDEQFTDEEGIKCPIDGPVAKTIKEFKLLNNLITDKTVPSQRNNDKKRKNINDNLSNTCQIHKGQKLTHIVINTKEIICVYCAFDLVRKNPNCEVRELKEKFDEYCNVADKIISINQNNVEIIQNSLKDIKENKKREEKKVIFYFEHIIKYINTKKNEILSKIDSIFTDNATKLSQKLENFSAQIELGENLKEIINEYNKNNSHSYNEIYENYLKLESLNENEKNNKINLQEYKFIHDDETKMIKYINCLGDIKCIFKYIPFQGDIQDIYDLNNNIINDIDNNNNCYQKQIMYNNTSPNIIDDNLNVKRRLNNNKYCIDNLMLNKNKSFILTNKRDNNNLNVLDDDMGNYINTNNSLNNNYLHTFTNNNINNNLSKYNIRINSNPKDYLNCEDFQRLNKKYNNYNITNFKSYNDSEIINNNNKYKYNKKNNNYSKRTNSNSLYKEIKKNNSEYFQRISSPGRYKYDFRHINK